MKLLHSFVLLGGAIWIMGTGLASGQQQAPQTVVFTDVTEASGIHFVHSFGDENMSSILEATGSGAMFFDYDNDGWMDLYAVNGAYLEGISDPPRDRRIPELTNHLFRNNGDGTFTNVTVASGTGDTGYGMACIAADYNNNGHTDIYITNYGRNTLLRNNGDGTFTDVTGLAGVGDELWGVGAVFLDYDNDGELDLYVGNYLEFDPEYRLFYAADLFPGPLAYPGQPDVLYRNNGDGTFTDVTEAAGVLNEGRAMGIIAGDYNDDGWIDIFVANDAMGNYLYRNNGDGTFTDVALEAGVAFSADGESSASMGGDFGDFNRNGRLDLFVPDMAYNNLYVNMGDGFFEDRTAAKGIAELSGQYVSWHGDFFDYNNNGYLDIFMTNGDAHRLTNTMEPLLLANVPGAGNRRKFEDVSLESGAFFRYRLISRGAAAADYDNDGDLDLFVLNIGRQPSLLLRNDGGNARNWLMLHLVGTRSNRSAIGARVTVQAGDLVQIAETKTGTGYLSQNDPRLHFGLDGHTRVDTITVRWPSGRVQQLVNVAAGQVVSIEEPAE